MLHEPSFAHDISANEIVPWSHGPACVIEERAHLNSRLSEKMAMGNTTFSAENQGSD